ncbi:hypothetical protein FGM00_04770 [Aggregatimonas sangjinii]|uniref:Metallo-beta-lactamase domain-containing protein n=1 Tax=Aggregatimonas sangjinii TaxID=2583587 RepID=A0A5B7SLL1_9FLAO|nr:MBL fold metallo-hydrolase [Aggregatimonas sangjinii]QCW99455.1 hypothetical protein FGM00_04770 [Aggregatimonas sangjinii]
MKDTEQNALPLHKKFLSAELGSILPILDNVYTIKADKHRYRYGNMYIIVHQEHKKLLLIDAVRDESVQSLKNWMANGYSISGVFLTHRDLLGQAYAPLHEISEDLGNAPIFIHPDDTPKNSNALFDITCAIDIFTDFNVQVHHSPGHTPGSVVIYAEMNGGILFTGDSAVGSPYEEEQYYFERPPNNEENDERLRGFWENVEQRFKHILPLHGKPQFGLNEMQQDYIVKNLCKAEKTKSL